MRHWLRRLTAKTLAPLGYTLMPVSRQQVIPAETPNAAWYQGPEDFSRLLRPWLDDSYDRLFTPAVLQNTMLSRKKLYYLLCLLEQTFDLPGAWFEAGVGSGGSARLMLNCLQEAGQRRTLWLLDTFAGYAAVDQQKDGGHVRERQCQCASRAEVGRLLADGGADVRLIEGAIPATLAAVETPEIAFAHIDVNLYEPTRAATEFCLARMRPGGVILFDDYGWPATFGARRAIDEVCAATGQRPISLAESTQAFLLRRRANHPRLPV